MAVPNPLEALAVWGLDRLLAERSDVAVRFELWDGRSVGRETRDAVAVMRLHDPEALLRLLYDPQFQFGELYGEGRLEVEGDLPELLRQLLLIDTVGWAGKLLPAQLLAKVLPNDLGAARANAQHHYDVGNEFYSLWLDERMLYTCAYFESPKQSLEDAQLAKMEHVCRKVALRPGQHVIEAGCGWGALALHMARYYGVTVRAYNVSTEQIAWAREQAEKQGLAGRVEFIEDDYRNAVGRCDAFVSVGMLEHVGRAHYGELGEVIERCLEPHGLGLLHTIGRNREARLNRWIRTRVFPNAHPPTLREMTEILEPRDFAVLDVENLRRHYALTARHWYERYLANEERLRTLVDANRLRSWRLYLAGTTASFEASTICLFQLVFSRARNDRIPWTRAYLYTGAEPEFVPGHDD